MEAHRFLNIPMTVMVLTMNINHLRDFWHCTHCQSLKLNSVNVETLPVCNMLYPNL